MRSMFLLFLSLGLVLVSFLACGGDAQDPKSLLKAGDDAFRADKDYDKAIASFQAVLDGKGENKPSDAQVQKASLGLLRSKVFKKDYEGTLASLKTMDKTILTIKNYCTIVGDMVKQKAGMEAIDVIGLTIEQYPDKKELLSKQVEEIKKLGVSSEAIEKLKTLGYL